MDLSPFDALKPLAGRALETALNHALAGLFVVEDLITRAVPVPFGVSLLVRARRPT